MAAFLEKSTESEGFHQVINFLSQSHISYALTKKPEIYISFIKQFWRTAEASTDTDGEVTITAIIDAQSKAITEASLRRHLKLEYHDEQLESKVKTNGKARREQEVVHSEDEEDDLPNKGGYDEDLSGRVVYGRRSKETRKDKGKAIMTEPEPNEKYQEVIWNKRTCIPKKTTGKRKKSLPRTRTRDSTKKQKVELDDEKEDLKGYLDIVPREDVAVDVDFLSKSFTFSDRKMEFHTYAYKKEDPQSQEMISLEAE
ncbi:hypothetical protein Tco_0138478 [Tanacetum coccineum]